MNSKKNAGLTLPAAALLARAVPHSTLDVCSSPAVVCAALAAVLCPATALAQALVAPTVPALAVKTAVREQIVEGDKATTSRLPKIALEHYESALQADPRSYDALWKAASAEIDLGEAEQDDKKREALYVKALGDAQKSVEANPDGADGYFTVAHALGRKALTVGARERVKFGTAVRANALKALELNPKHPGALHIMAVWNAEIMRLNGFTRLFARTFLGGQILSTASWSEAVRYIEESIALDPDRAVHRLDQARIYRDLGRKADARAAYEATINSPLIDANDELYRQSAVEELRAMH